MPADEYVLLFNNSRHLNGVALWALGKLYWYINGLLHRVGHNVSVVCRCFQQWYVEHSHIRRHVLDGSTHRLSEDTYIAKLRHLENHTEAVDLYLMN